MRSQVARVNVAPETLLAVRRNREIFNLDATPTRDGGTIRFVQASAALR